MSIKKEPNTEDDFGSYLSNSPTACLVLDKNWKLKEANLAFKELVDFEEEEEELLNFSFTDIIAANDKENALHIISDLEKIGNTNSNLKLLKKDKSEVSVHLNGFEISNSNFILFCTKSENKSDSSEKLSLNSEIKKEALIHEKTSQIARIGTWNLDISTSKITWSDVTKEIHEVAIDYEPSSEKTINFYLEGHYRNRIKFLVNSAIKQGKPYDEELQIVTQKNNIKWVRAIGIPEIHDKKTIRLYGVFQDITIQKTSEAENVKLKKRYKNLYDNSPAMSISFNAHKRIIECNNTALIVLGYTSDELTTMSINQLLTPESNNLFKIDFPIFEKQGKLTNVERQFITKDGEVIDTILSATMDYDSNGKPLKTNAVFIDVSEKKSIEIKLAQSEEEFRTLFELSVDAIMTMGEKNFLNCNQAALKIFGCDTKEEFLKMNPSDISPKFQSDGTESVIGIKNKIEESAKNGGITFEWTSSKVDGTIFQSEIILSPIKLGGKDVFQGIIRDISNKRLLEDKLKKSHQELESRIEERTAELIKVNNTLKQEILVKEKIAEVLKETYQRWDSLVNNTKAMISIVRHDGTIEFMGNLTEKVKKAGLSSKDMTGNFIYDYHLEKNHSDIKKAIEKIKKDGSTINLRVNGAMSESVYDCTIAPWHNQGAIAGSIWIYNDVTEKLALEKKIAASEERYRRFIGHSNEGIWRIEFKEKLSIKSPIDKLAHLILEAPITEVNDAMAKIYGYNHGEEILGENLFKLFGANTEKENNIVIERSKNFIQNNFSAENIILSERNKQGDRIYISNSTLGDIEDGYLVRLWGVQRDVTKQVLAENALKKSESGLAEAQRIAHIGDWHWNSIKNELFWSDETYRLFGYQPQEVDISFDFYLKHVGKNFRSDIKAIIKLAIEDQKPYNYQFKATTKTGIVKLIEAQGEAILDDQGEFIGTRGVYQDITEKKVAENALIESEKRFRDIALIGSDWVWEIDKKGNYIYCSERVKDVLGYSKEEILKMTPFDLMSENDAAAERIHFDEWTKNPRDIKYHENWNVTKNGERVCLLSNMVIILDDEGKFFGMRGVDQDITEKKVAENALKKSESNLAEAQRIAHIGDWNWDSVKNRLIWSDETYRLFGYQPQEVDISFDFYLKHVHKDYIRDVKATISLAFEDHKPYSYQFKARTKTKKIKIIEVHGEIILNDEGESIGSRGVYQDITEKKTAEVALLKARFELEKKVEARTKDFIFANTELKQATKEANDALKVKEEFLSTMSHEIRTPLNAIIGTVNLLHLLDPKPDQIDNLNLLKLSSDNLLTLINDILDFNKMDAGKIALESIDFNLKNLLIDVKKFMVNKASDRGLDLILNYPKDLPEVFIGDSFRISQVIINLIANAIKFTEYGYVKLEVIKIKKENDQYTLRIQVSDTGIGITQDKLNTIFENFQQAGDNVSRQYGGTGLGLSIAKQLVELMGGEFFVESEIDHGSVFYFDIKLGLGDDYNYLQNTNEEPNSYLIENDLHILVAEDNEGNRIIIQQFLSLWSINSDFAHNGKEAIAMVESTKYDMVLMDIQMPEMDGLEATKRIRNMDDVYFKNIPIIALTAFATSDVIIKAKKAGMNDHVVKPFKPKDLFEKITQYAPEFSSKQVSSENDNIISSNFETTFPYLFGIFEGNQEMIINVIDTIQETIPKELDLLSKYSSEENFKMCSDILHAIKPNMESIGLDKLAIQCNEMEVSIANESYESINLNMENFITSLRKEMSEIELKISNMN